MSTIRTLAGAASIAALALATSACSIGVDLDGETGTRDVEVGDFRAIDLNGSGDVFVTVGQEPSVRIEADTAILDDVRVTVGSDGVLSLDGLKGWFTWFGTDIDYYVTVTDLEQLTIDGSGNAEIEGVDAEDFKVEINGSGDITADGRADDFEIEINGAGSIHGADLDATAVDVEINGSGDADVTVTDSLHVSISGSGNVTYGGTPSITTDIAGSGDVNARASE